ncbi:MAG: prephenate dehydrogenase [Lewinellaceae bacterium]|nr:prephenate dehydrogenase [Lewinella sp.]MCB9282406.1 prephenate dehydrogenase [Lewinellaceae bacterium]
MNITIIGIGLIGGSMAITLKENGFATRVIGVDANQANLDKAVRRRLIDEDMPFDEGVKAADIVIVATPVNTILDIVPRVLDLVDRQVVMDVGSTKTELLKGIARHPKRGRFVATHPMAGTEYSGPEAAIPNLFDRKCTVLCNAEESDPDALAIVEKLYESIPMRKVWLDSESHDLHAAYVSHISHISSFALALTVLEKERDESRIFELASGGFDSTVRLAKSSPDMWAPIFQQNRDNLLDVLDEHINQLSRFRSLLIKRDFKTFYALMQEANNIRKILK